MFLTLYTVQMDIIRMLLITPHTHLEDFSPTSLPEKTKRTLYRISTGGNVKNPSIKSGFKDEDDFQFRGFLLINRLYCIESHFWMLGQQQLSRFSFGFFLFFGNSNDL